MSFCEKKFKTNVMISYDEELNTIPCEELVKVVTPGMLAP